MVTAIRGKDICVPSKATNVLKDKRNAVCVEALRTEKEMACSITSCTLYLGI
jgi:hypothetical protein